MKKILFVSILLAAVCACTKENFSNQEVSDGLYPITITTDAEGEDVNENDETKAYMYFNSSEMKFKFRWLSGGNEKLIAFDNKCINGGHEFKTLSDPKPQNAKATISGSVCAEATGQVVFLYPYQVNSWTKKWNDIEYKFNTGYDVDNKKITEIFIPYNRSQIKTGNNALENESNVRVGVLPSKESTDKLCMYNPLAAVYFNLTGSGTHKVTRVEIFGNNCEKLAGYCDIDIANTNAPKVVFFPEPYLSHDKNTRTPKGHRVAYDLFLNTGGSEIADGQYLASIAPNNFTKGLTVKFTDNKGNVAFATSSKALDIPANHIKNLGTFNVDALDWHFALDLRFIPGAYLKDGNKNNPFGAGKDIITTKNTRNKEVFTLTDGSGKTADFYTYCPSDGEIGYYDNGLNIKGVGGYIEIPAIEGKVLKTIFFRASATGGHNGQPCIVRARDGKYLTTSGTFEESITNADIWKGNNNKVIFGDFKSWSNCFATGENYRIHVTRNDNEAMKIMGLVLLYDDATKATALTTPQVNDWNLGEGAEALMY